MSVKSSWRSMAVGRLVLLWWLTVVTALPNPDAASEHRQAGPAEVQVFPWYGERRASIDSTREGPMKREELARYLDDYLRLLVDGSETPANFQDQHVLLMNTLEGTLRDREGQAKSGEIQNNILAESNHLRKKRGIKRGDGHVIESFKHIPRKALNVATQVVSDISQRDCAVHCIKVQCKAWSHNNVTNQCRFLSGTKNTKKYVPVPVTEPDSDYFEISVRNFGAAIISFLTGGATSHNIDIKPSQIKLIEDPLAPENVLTDVLEPIPTPTSPPTDPPTDSPPQPPNQTVTEPTIPVPDPSPTDAPTPAPDLTYQFPFPSDCGRRPTFGLSDYERRLQPSGFKDRTRVVGGTAVATGTYPWQAQIETSTGRGYEHSCGGIIISDDLILTAAHCHTTHESKYQVRVAENDRDSTADPDERVLAVENIYRNSGHRPDFRRGQKNDIAMMRLKFRNGEPHGLTFTDYIQPLCLPQQNTSLVVGQECQISGWGLVDSGQVRSPDNAAQYLRGAVINILDPAICRKAYGERFDERLMICAGKIGGGVDTCSGDSGGPLSCRDSFGRWFAAGIVSFGWECGAAGHPGVYTRVSAFLEFVHRTAAFLTRVPVVL